MVVKVGDEDVARPVHRHARGVNEACGGPRAVRASIRTRSPGKRGHYASRRDLSDGVVVCVGDEDIARTVHRYATGPGGVHVRDAEACDGPGAVRAS